MIGMAINEWQNNYCGAVSMPIDCIGTRVVGLTVDTSDLLLSNISLVDTAKHFIIPIETLFV